MRLLLDEHLPIGLSAELLGHAVDTVSDCGWSGIENDGPLCRMSGQYDVLITMDRSIECQQRLSTLPSGIVLVRARSNRMQDPRPLELLDGIKIGELRASEVKSLLDLPIGIGAVLPEGLESEDA